MPFGRQTRRFPRVDRFSSHDSSLDTSSTNSGPLSSATDSEKPSDSSESSTHSSHRVFPGASVSAVPEERIPQISRYVADFSVILDAIVMRDHNRAFRRRQQGDTPPISDERRNLLLARCIGKRLNWRTWVTFCGSEESAICTLLLRQFGESVPRTVSSSVELGLFKVSRRGYIQGLRSYIVEKFGIDVDYLERFSFATISNLRDFVSWYVTLLVELRLFELPQDDVIRICIFVDANSKAARLKVNGFFFHFLDVPDCGASYSYLPFLFQIGKDSRTSIETMLRCRPRAASHALLRERQRSIQRRARGRFRWMRFEDSHIGRRPFLLRELVIKGKVYRVCIGGVADYKALSSFFLLEDIRNTNIAFPGFKRNTARGGDAYTQGLQCAWNTCHPCPCMATPFDIFSLRTDDFPVPAVLPPRTTFDGISVPHIMEGMLHGIQSAFGFCRDLLVVCAHRRRDLGEDGVMNVVSRAFASFDFGPGWDWQFGTSTATCEPLDPDDVAKMQKEHRLRNAKPKAKPKAKPQAKPRRKIARPVAQPNEFSPRPLEEGKGMELRFRPEYTKILQFFGIGWDDKDKLRAPWLRAFFALKSFQAHEPAVSPLRNAHVALANLHDWVECARSSEPSSVTLKSTGHAVWKFWIRMLSATFPTDPGKFHQSLRDAKRVPPFDKRKFAIGVGAHCVLIHSWQWVILWGPKYFPRAIETGGEHVLYLTALLIVHLMLRNMNVLVRAGSLLFYSIAFVVAKTLRAAQSKLCTLRLMDVALAEAAASVFKAAGNLSASSSNTASSYSKRIQQCVVAAKAAGCASRTLSHVQKQISEVHVDVDTLFSRTKRGRAASGLRQKSGPHNRYCAQSIKDLPPVLEAQWRDAPPMPVCSRSMQRRVQALASGRLIRVPAVRPFCPSSAPAVDLLSQIRAVPISEEVIAGLQAQAASPSARSVSTMSGRASRESSPPLSSSKSPHSSDLEMSSDATK